VNDWIEVFRAGSYGDKGRFTQQDLDRIVASYDPAKHEAPVVAGHPEHDAPAYGWVEGLKRQGDVLMAKLKQVPAAFEQAVKDGRFKKRSVALYGDAASGFSLRHVGFLGAMPPEVKGLADVKFGQGEYRAIEFTEETMKEETKQTFMEALKDFFKDFKFSERTAAVAEQKHFTEADLATAIEKATTPFKTQLEALSTKFNELGTTTAAGAVQQKADTAIGKLKAANKWIPAFDKMGVPAIFAALAASSTVITFGEGEKAVKKSALEVFAEFMDGLPKIVPAGEIAKAASGARPSVGGKVINFNEAPRIGLDQDSVLFNEAAEKLSTDKKITLGEAMKQLRASGWQPQREGQASAGAV
jgi:hypothetical protein